MNKTKWIIFPRPNRDAQMRLFCFSFAGGNASTYYHWPNYLPDGVEVAAIQLPGRMERVREQPIGRIEPLIDQLSAEIYPYLDKPFAIFGHSLGALVGYECAVALRERYGVLPVHYFASARRAPHIHYESDPPIHRHARSVLIELLRRYNGVPQLVLQDEQLIDLFLPTIRADFEISETYCYKPTYPLECPVTTFLGKGDRSMMRSEVRAWQAHTTASYQHHDVEGDHFFIRNFAVFMPQITTMLQQLLYQPIAV